MVAYSPRSRSPYTPLSVGHGQRFPVYVFQQLVLNHNFNHRLEHEPRPILPSSPSRNHLGTIEDMQYREEELPQKQQLPAALRKSVDNVAEVSIPFYLCRH